MCHMDHCTWCDEDYQKEGIGLHPFCFPHADIALIVHTLTQLLLSTHLHSSHCTHTDTAVTVHTLTQRHSSHCTHTDIALTFHTLTQLSLSTHWHNTLTVHILTQLSLSTHWHNVHYSHTVSTRNGCKLCTILAAKPKYWLCWVFLVRRSFRTGKLASWLASQVISSFIHMTPRVGQRACFSRVQETRRACFVVEFMTFTWCLWRAYWFLWNVLNLVYGRIWGNRATCIRIADAKRDQFSIRLPRNIQIRSAIPQIYRSIKLRSYAP